MSFKLNLKGNRVAVLVEKKEDVTKSGIIIPDSARELPNKAKVVAKGPGIFSPQLAALRCYRRPNSNRPEHQQVHGSPNLCGAR